MTLNFIPDGKQSNMSKITSKLDVKEVAGGKSATTQVDKDKKKAEEELKKVGEDGEVKLSKKDLAKLAKKANKEAIKSGEAPIPKGKGAPPAKKEAVAVSKNLSALQVKLLADCEAKLVNSQFIAGATPSAADREAFELLKPIMFEFSAASHPHTFGWFALVFKFGDAVKASW